MISVRSNNLSLKYLRFTPSGFKGIEIRKFEFVAKTQFLYTITKLQDQDLSSSLLLQNVWDVG